jgi:hypothetical protein
LFTLDVDGERFAIRRAEDGGTAYDWLSGPNKGYGFGSSGTPNRSMEEHRESIRAFLAMIDPNTGYIGDDWEERVIRLSLPDADIGMSASPNWHYRSVMAGT